MNSFFESITEVPTRLNPRSTVVHKPISAKLVERGNCMSSTCPFALHEQSTTENSDPGLEIRSPPSVKSNSAETLDGPVPEIFNTLRPSSLNFGLDRILSNLTNGR